MHMINFLYKIDGKNEFRIKRKNLLQMSLPDLLVLMKAEQEGKIKLVVEE